MFCTECGTRNRDGAKFCMVCGHAMESPGSASVSATTPSAAVAAPALASAPNPTTTHVAGHASDRAAFYRQRSDRIQKLTGVKGWLFLLCLSLGVIGPLVNIASLTSQWMEALRGDGPADFVPQWTDFLTMHSLMVAGIVITSMLVAYRLYREVPGAPKVAKVYYVTVPLVFILWSGFFWQAYGYGPMSDRIVRILLTREAIMMITGSILWLSYLQFSRRVRYTYPDPAEHVRCPECRGFVHKYSVQCRHCGVKLVPVDAR